MDKILENISDGSSINSFGNVAVLYRRQVKLLLFVVFLIIILDYSWIVEMLAELLVVSGVRKNLSKSLPRQKHSV